MCPSLLPLSAVKAGWPETTCQGLQPQLHQLHTLKLCLVCLKSEPRAHAVAQIPLFSCWLCPDPEQLQRSPHTCLSPSPSPDPLARPIETVQCPQICPTILFSMDCTPRGCLGENQAESLCTPGPGASSSPQSHQSHCLSWCSPVLCEAKGEGLGSIRFQSVPDITNVPWAQGPSPR